MLHTTAPCSPKPLHNHTTLLLTNINIAILILTPNLSTLSPLDTFSSKSLLTLRMPPPQSLLQTALTPISLNTPFAAADLNHRLARREMIFRQEYLSRHIAWCAGFCG